MEIEYNVKPMDTYKIIEDLERKIKKEKDDIKKERISSIVFLSLSGALLVSFIVFLIIFLVENENISLIISISSISLALISFSIAALFYYTIKGKLKSIHMMEEALKSWHHKKPKISVPLDFDRN